MALQFRPDVANELANLAAMIAIESPEKPQAHQIQVTVRIGILYEIRAKLEAAGFDWRAARKRVHAILKQQQAERTAK